MTFLEAIKYMTENEGIEFFNDSYVRAFYFVKDGIFKSRITNCEENDGYLASLSSAEILCDTWQKIEKKVELTEDEIKGVILSIQNSIKNFSATDDMTRFSRSNLSGIVSFLKTKINGD